MVKLVEYFKQWYPLMINGIFNIVSHKSLVKGVRYMGAVSILMGIIYLLFIVYWIKKSKGKKYVFVLFVIFIAYTLYLFLNVNYVPYLKHASLMGVQGRYLFPVISCFIVIVSCLFIEIFNKKWMKWSIIGLIFVFLFWGEGYYVLRNYKKWCFDNIWLSSKFGNFGEINKGMSTDKQYFNLKKEKNNILGIGIYASTYSQSIGNGFFLNLYESNCRTLIYSYPIYGIKDNSYFVVKFEKVLPRDNEGYCFSISNNESEKPITIWYSGINLVGTIVGKDFKDLEKDYIYDLLEESLMNKYNLGQ